VDNTLIVREDNSVDEPEKISVGDLLGLSGERVLVTGASGNIGQGIARRLAEAGADIVAHYHRNEAPARELIEHLGKGRAVQADLRDEESVDRMLAVADVTLVVNNAAVQTVQNLADLSLSDWQLMMAANLDSAFLVTQRVARIWSEADCSNATANRSGVNRSIVNIGSIEGMDPAAGHGHYATSKAGLLMMTRAAALEFGADGIRVNCVSPGLISRDGLAEDWPEGVSRWLDRAPLGRIGTPNDVADAVLFLLSPAARWISGANLVVDGGMSTQGKW
jgi:NAD(P)-dependent dehydrogenase (short-subunit alcohol dehydrogenase family)